MAYSFTWQDVDDEVTNDRVADNARIQEPAPEVILDSSGILEPDDEDVPRDGDGNKEQDGLPHQRVLDHHLSEQICLVQI